MEVFGVGVEVRFLLASGLRFQDLCGRAHGSGFPDQARVSRMAPRPPMSVSLTPSWFGDLLRGLF